MRILRFLSAAALAAAALAEPARAITLLRDPGIEHALRELSAPVFDAAGIDPQRSPVLIVADRRANAFVIGSGAMFVNSGLLLNIDRAETLQAVIAHEAAHVSHGHLVRRPINARRAEIAGGAGAVLAATLALAATGDGQIAAGAALGASTAAQRVYFSHTQSEESAADQSAVRFLAAAGIDPGGMVTLMEMFDGRDALAGLNQDPYTRTHPPSRERTERVRRLVADAGGAAPNPAAAYWFDRAKGKLSAFSMAPRWTLDRLSESPHEDVRAMREAVAWHRRSDTGQAVTAIERALALRPGDPFYHELKGQILMESRRFEDAEKAYAEAARLAPRHALILGAHGRALLALGRSGAAIEALESSYELGVADPRILHDLARAHAEKGDTGMSSLLTAERYAVTGKLKDAGIHARRALDQLPRGSPGWIKAQDIEIAAVRAESEAKRRRKR